MLPLHDVLPANKYPVLFFVEADGLIYFLLYMTNGIITIKIIWYENRQIVHI